MLSVQHARPSLELAHCVYGYVQRVSQPDQSSHPHIVEPVVARSGSMLEFQFGEPLDAPIYGLDLPNPSVPITIVGPIRARNVRLIIRSGLEGFTVLFRPLGLYTVFAIPLARFVGTGTEGGAVLGAPVGALYEQLGNLRSFADRIKVVESFLTERLRRRRPLHPAESALRILASTNKQRTVRSVAAQTGISTRQLERLSMDYTGITPIELARLARFQKALRLRQTTTESWTWIAHAANYHDQMHMIREFRSLAGNTPERAIGDLSPDHLISFMCR